MPPPADPYSKFMFDSRENRIKKEIRLNIDEATK